MLSTGPCPASPLPTVKKFGSFRPDIWPDVVALVKEFLVFSGPLPQPALNKFLVFSGPVPGKLCFGTWFFLARYLPKGSFHCYLLHSSHFEKLPKIAFQLLLCVFPGPCFSGASPVCSPFKPSLPVPTPSPSHPHVHNPPRCHPSPIPPAITNPPLTSRLTSPTIPPRPRHST